MKARDHHIQSLSYISLLSASLVLLQGCMAHIHTPSPLDVGRECEPSDAGARRFATGVVLGALALSALSLATIPPCDSPDCESYDGIGNVILAGPVAGSLALYGYIEWRHGKYNASECRLYLDSLARQIKIQAQEDIDENLED